MIAPKAPASIIYVHCCMSSRSHNRRVSKLNCRRYSKHCYVITRRNVHQHVFTIEKGALILNAARKSRGTSPNLDDIAVASPAITRLTRIATLLLTFLWILFLITFSTRVSVLGMLYHVHVTNHKRTPEGNGAALKPTLDGKASSVIGSGEQHAGKSKKHTRQGLQGALLQAETLGTMNSIIIADAMLGVPSRMVHSTTAATTEICATPDPIRLASTFYTLSSTIYYRLSSVNESQASYVQMSYGRPTPVWFSRFGPIMLWYFVLDLLIKWPVDAKARCVVERTSCAYHVTGNSAICLARGVACSTRNMAVGLKHFGAFTVDFFYFPRTALSVICKPPISCFEA
ncbi:uncharacterized protein BDR25DRAFT_350328 [Lindgomyces ingoldianus]|uniref:Uncharacterized protein n=1 Tax=Lindgomyces ingoldianus TaxID=673940 RepID=A0ACB6RBI1_9PLEO|nr:uncharacterized protein BDR25DRAFT_350328 [Lindgomyces ingoldianus]KAF2476065.1 hypothetical protein BDR25DRAFT_350328 [Lindgomyces ingoldianus]